MGVFHPDLVGIQVRVLQQLGSHHVLVVHGKDGMDEMSLGAATLVGELKDGEVREYEIHPEDFGLRMMSNRSLRVADARRIEGDGARGTGRQGRHARTRSWSSTPAWRCTRRMSRNRFRTASSARARRSPAAQRAASSTSSSP